MPRTKEQNAERRQATREKIQAAAAELFAQKGLAGTSVQEIADLAGISIGLLYRHYKTKESLFAEMVEFALDGLVTITELFQSDTPPKELLTGFVNEIYNDLNNNGEFINTLVFMTQAYLSGSEAGDIKRLIEQDTQMLCAAAALIRRGQDLGELRAGDADKMAALLFSTIQGLGIMKAIMGDAFSMPTPKMITAHLIKEGEH